MKIKPGCITAACLVVPMTLRLFSGIEMPNHHDQVYIQVWPHGAPDQPDGPHTNTSSAVLMTGSL
jgi:hypothetical protein